MIGKQRTAKCENGSVNKAITVINNNEPIFFRSILKNIIIVSGLDYLWF